jgi:cell division protein FtsB
MRTSLLTKKKTWLESPILAIVLIIFAVWGIVAVVRAYLKQHEAVSLRDEAVHEEESLEQKQKDLSGQIDNLSTPNGLEAEVRERYRVVKPGEQLVIVVDNDNAIPNQKAETFWQRIRQFVGF